MPHEPQYPHALQYSGGLHDHVSAWHTFEQLQVTGHTIQQLEDGLLVEQLPKKCLPALLPLEDHGFLFPNSCQKSICVLRNGSEESEQPFKGSRRLGQTRACLSRQVTQAVSRHRVQFFDSLVFSSDLAPFAFALVSHAAC